MAPATTLFGGAGDDLFSTAGTGPTDLIYGGEGNDTIYGGSDKETAYGDGGDDVIWGYAGNDGLFGGGGDDTIKMAVPVSII